MGIRVADRQPMPDGGQKLGRIVVGDRHHESAIAQWLGRQDENNPRLSFRMSCRFPPVANGRGLPSKARTNPLDSRFQGGETMGADSPEDIRSYRSVIMAQDVADPGDLLPRDLRFCCLQAIRDPAAGLRDDFEIAFDQLADTPVGDEPLEAQSGGIYLDVGDRLENVVSLEPRVA